MAVRGGQSQARSICYNDVRFFQECISIWLHGTCMAKPSAWTRRIPCATGLRSHVFCSTKHAVGSGTQFSPSVSSTGRGHVDPNPIRLTWSAFGCRPSQASSAPQVAIGRLQWVSSYTSSLVGPSLSCSPKLCWLCSAAQLHVLHCMHPHCSTHGA